MKSAKKIGTIVAVVVIVAVTTGAVMLISGSKKSGGGPGGRNFPQGMSSRDTVYSVITMDARKTTLKDFVMTNGEVETQSSIEVFPSIGGKVVEMNVSLGSPVRKGDVIAKIDPSEPGSYYALSPVTAPISGSILSAPVRTGAKVSVSSVVTTIGDIENLQVTAKIPERYVASLVPGLKAEILLEAYPDSVFAATVTRVSPVLDPATRTKEIILNFDRRDSRINAGMFAKVKLYTVDYAGAVAVPQDSVVENNDAKYLFVVKSDGTAEKREITTGKSVDGYIQITDGISEGDKVVIEGMLSLYDGAKVNDITKSAK